MSSAVALWPVFVSGQSLLWKGTKTPAFVFKKSGLRFCAAVWTTSLCFRYFLISWPQLLFIRQTKGYVLFCVLIWLFAIFLFPLFMMYSQYIFFVVFPLIPTPVFFFCVARTPKFLPAATSLTTEEKCRIVATLILLLIVHIFMILPLSVYYINPYFYETYVKFHSSLILFLFSPFMDLILFVFMCKGLVDKLLMCFSCHSCSRWNTSRVYDSTLFQFSSLPPNTSIATLYQYA